MEKITLGIAEIMKVKQSIDMLLRMAGIPFQKTYWLDNLRKKLSTPMNKWKDTFTPIFEKYAVKIPAEPFVPPSKYQEFKKVLMDRVEGCEEGEVYSSYGNLFAKYEITSEHSGQSAIPIESQKSYEAERDKAAGEFQAEIEYNKIEVDDNFMAVLQNLPGELQLALTFMFADEEKPSGIILPFKGGKILQ